MFKIKTTLTLLVSAMLVLTKASGQQRIVNSVNTQWQFHQGEVNNIERPDIQWEEVSIPHTWNAIDVTDDKPGYYQGPGVYKKKLFVDPSWKNKQVYLYFEGAGQYAEVYMNGKKVGTHTGGYSAFSFNVSPYLNFSDTNELVVHLTNYPDQDIAPLAADFTFFGGIYRDVYLIAADKVHFDMDNYASKGIFLTPQNVNNQSANLQIRGALVNQSTDKKNLTVETKLYDVDNKIVATNKVNYKLKPGEKKSFSGLIENIKGIQLWSPETPYLYRAVSVITDNESGKQLDLVENNIGFKWFSFDGQKGFMLNGHPYKLMGASRHQDYPGLGPALSDAMHERDIELLKNMGANFLRVAHYPQDPAVLEACDRLGLLAAVETPIVGRITETKAYTENCMRMQTEMIRQGYNHPSVILWAYMNEVMISPRHDQGTPQRDAYWQHIVTLAKSLDSLTRAEDPVRYTMIPFHGDYNRYKSTGMTEIPMVIGWNLYQGWYGAGVEGFASFLDRHHKELTNKPMIVTEYGADADVRLHSFQPLRFDKSAEYATYYHRYYIKQIIEKPWVAGGAIWNLVDFNSEGRTESTPHINTKGITTGQREPKGTYYLYKAYLAKEPYIKIGSRAWTNRSAVADNDADTSCTQPVEIYTNTKFITVLLNGQPVASAQAKDHFATVQVPFKNGDNLLEVIGTDGDQKAVDAASIQFRLIPHHLNSKHLPFTDIHVSLGDTRYFNEDKTGTVWVPEQPYQKGSWGYIGGEVFKLKNNDRLPYGTDRNILGTDNDPLYQSQRVGLKQFKLDVPDGTYEINMHFAELYTNKAAEPLVYNYNLGDNKAEAEKNQSRTFNISINGVPVIEGLSDQNYLEQLTPYIIKTKIHVINGKGITADFIPVSGNTILNAIEVKRI